jgi:acetyltransferase-like isoleucine patch superfamily enzyme
VNKDTDHYKAKGRFWSRARSTIFLLPAWFAPHKTLRVFFHRLRGVHIGKNVEIGYFCIIGHVHPHMIHIGNNAVITAKSVVLEHDNAYFYTVGNDVEFGEVQIGEGAFIGIGTIIMPGTEIGKGSIVGAMSLVKDDIPDRCVAAGIPAIVLKTLPKDDIPDVPLAEPTLIRLPSSKRVYSGLGLRTIHSHMIVFSKQILVVKFKQLFGIK